MKIRYKIKNDLRPGCWALPRAGRIDAYIVGDIRDDKVKFEVDQDYWYTKKEVVFILPGQAGITYNKTEDI